MNQVLNTFIAVLFSWSVSNLTLAAQSRSEENLYGQLTTNGVASVSNGALEQVLKTPDDLSAGILYVASAVALKKNRLEDAGFLLNVARFRAMFDSALFPPKETGGNNPMILFGALQQELGLVINPAMVSEPKVYSNVLARLKSWKPKAPATYEPGWEYSKRGSEKAAEEVLAKNQNRVLQFMSGISTLLRDDEYVSALRVVQNYNLGSMGSTNRPSIQEYQTAIHTLQRIENQKSIDAGASALK